MFEKCFPPGRTDLLLMEMNYFIQENGLKSPYVLTILKLAALFWDSIKPLIKVVLYLNSFLFIFSLRSMWKYESFFNNPESNGFYISVLLFFVILFSFLIFDGLLGNYVGDIGVGEWFLIFVKQIGNGNLHGAEASLKKAMSMTRNGNSLASFHAFCISIIGVIDILDKPIEEEEIAFALNKISHLESFCFRNDFCCWAKVRLYIELGNKEKAIECLEHGLFKHHLSNTLGDLLKKLIQDVLG